MIEVQNLTKRYGRTTAVDGISFKVEKGEILGFLGPNGAGKTTTMRVLTCYLPPSAGTAKVAGYDVFTEPIEVKRRVAGSTASVPRSASSPGSIATRWCPSGPGTRPRWRCR